jgi:hypothetical protein
LGASGQGVVVVSAWLPAHNGGFGLVSVGVIQFDFLSIILFETHVFEQKLNFKETISWQF